MWAAARESWKIPAGFPLSARLAPHFTMVKSDKTPRCRCHSTMVPSKLHPKNKKSPPWGSEILAALRNNFILQSNDLQTKVKKPSPKTQTHSTMVKSFPRGFLKKHHGGEKISPWRSQTKHHGAGATPPWCRQNSTTVPSKLHHGGVGTPPW